MTKVTSPFKRRVLVALGLGIVLVPLAGLVLLGRQSRGETEVPFDGTRLRSCPPRPNCVCSQDTGEAAVAPLVLGAASPAAFEAFLAEVEALPGASRVRHEGGYAHFTFDTALFGFRDDVEFLWAAGTTTVDVRSGSRVGHSDLGANAVRVAALRPLAERAGR